MSKQRAAVVTAALWLSAALGAGGARAAAVVEAEPNDTLGSAQFVANTESTISIDASRPFADPSNDFFAFDVGAPGTLSIVLTSADASADTIIGLYGPSGLLLASADDGGAGSLSALAYDVTELGRYTLGVSGFDAGLLACAPGVTVGCYDTDGDFVFDTYVPGVDGGGPSSGFDYTVSLAGVGIGVGAVPEPASAALVALGLGLGLWPRRRAAAPSAGPSTPSLDLNTSARSLS